MKPEILLSNGQYYNYADPDPAVVTIETIAASLSKQCRFSGHVARFYSVAEHCVRGSFFVPPEDALAFLLHDAAEAFVVDIPTPMKVLLPDYRAIEDRAHEVVAKKFGVTWSPAVKQMDLVMLATEKRDLLPETELKWRHLEGIEPLPIKSLASESGNSTVWERKYLNRFAELTHVA